MNTLHSLLHQHTNKHPKEDLQIKTHILQIFLNFIILLQP